MKLLRFLTYAAATVLILVSLPLPVVADTLESPVITVTNVSSYRGTTINRDFLEVGLTINSPTPITTWSVRLISNGKQFGSRSELSHFATNIKASGRVLASKEGQVPLESKTSYSLSILTTGEKASVRELGASGFWIQFLKNGTVVKSIPIFSFGSGGYGIKPTPITWMLPLVEPAHRDLLGNFIDDDLAKALAPEGRLGRILNFSNNHQITWLIDPYLIESVEAMTREYTYGKKKPGTGQAVATAWLAQLRNSVATNLVVALPYGDPDLVTMAHAHLKSELAQAITEGVVRLSALLKVPVARTAAWPFNGLLDKQTQSLIKIGGTSSLLLSSDAITLTQTATEPSSSITQSGPNQLVFDSMLSKLFKKLTPITANQIAADLTMITAERPAIARGQLILPPRLWDPGNESISTLIAGVPIQEISLADLESLPRKRTSAVKFAALKPLKEGEVDALPKVTKNLKRFSLVIPTNSLYMVDAILRSKVLLATSWRAATLDAYIYSLRAVTTSKEVVGQVRVLAGQYTLTSLRQKLPITIANDSPEPATIVLRLVPTTYRVFLPKDVQITIEPRSKTQVMVPIEAITSGDLALSASVSSTSGEILGDVTELSLRIRTVPAIATWIMEGAALLLILGAGAQILRRLRSRKIVTTK